MSITPGYTNEQIAEFVYTYDRQPYGSKGRWLEEQDISRGMLLRWRRTVYDGDLDNGLIPRKGSSMSSPNPKRRATARSEAAKSLRISQLEERIAELEDNNACLKNSNEALGKAIGLLHEITVPESDDTPEQTPPADSSTSTTP